MISVKLTSFSVADRYISDVFHAPYSHQMDGIGLNLSV